MQVDLFNTEQTQLLLKQKKFNEVHTLCLNTLNNPKASDNEKKYAYHLQGLAFYFENNIGKAIEYFKTALELDPKFTDSAITLSVIYNDLGKYEEAKKVYDLANQSLTKKNPGTDLALDRKFSLKHIELGDLYFKFHRFDEALEEYTKAIRLEPTVLEYRVKAVKVYAKKGFTTRAIQELKQICSEDQNYLPARIQLGLMYFSLGNVIDAELEWEKAREIDPHNEEVKVYLTMAKQATETLI